jgi:hypothetical protein
MGKVTAAVAKRVGNCTVVRDNDVTEVPGLNASSFRYYLIRPEVFCQIAFLPRLVSGCFIPTPAIVPRLVPR